MNKPLSLGLACIFTFYGCRGQSILKPDHDTTYYRSFKGSVIGRFFFSRNYIKIQLDPTMGGQSMAYHANTPLNLGLGLTYRSISGSYSRGLNFLKSDQIKGKTKSTDLQLHLYKKKWTIDAMGQFYRGFYLNPIGLGAPDNHSYYIRPDLNYHLLGFRVYRVLNDRRFSYGAGLSQNAWQLKSAGSFLLGAELFAWGLSGDSALVPQRVDSSLHNRAIQKLLLYELGPGAGYAYTLVLGKHYFLLGSFNANINIRYSRETGNDLGKGRLDFSPNMVLRFGGGYNTYRWGIHLIWVTSSLDQKAPYSGYDHRIHTGNYRLIFARRLAFNTHMKQIIGQGTL